MNEIMNQKGVTLIALVITIIVLIILAGVSIGMLIGDNGLIKKAEQAKKDTLNATIAEQESLNKILEEYNTILNENSSGDTTIVAGSEVEKPDNWSSNKVIPIADGNGGTVPLPNGFYYVGGDVNTGIVISDKQADTLDASGTSMGNQFVWIPVPNQESLTRLKSDENGITTAQLRDDYTEPYPNGYATEASEYDKMKSQVLQYGGFYIGRYEAGVNSTTLRTTATTAQTVVSKKGVAPYNYIAWGKAMNDASEINGESGAVYLAKSMYNTSESVTSTLVYGCQWDAMCRYIEDNERIIQKKSAPELTGSVLEDVSKNIYDLAGNCWEWTMEACGTNIRVTRGGNYYFSYAVNNRYYGNADGRMNGYAFRCALYIK